MLKVGIVGLPNVGKSSLFNALTAQGAPSENFPFCTVEPNVGVVEVPDARLDRIHGLMNSASRVPNHIQFVDIAGLVEGASEGEGLGNRFLANIREVDAITHVLRCFDDDSVVHVTGSVDPLRDREIVETELILADLDLVDRRIDRVEKKARSGEKEAKQELEVLRPIKDALDRGQPAGSVQLDEAGDRLVRGYQLLTRKPTLYVLNVDEASLPEGENAHTRAVRESVQDAVCVSVCTAVESELAELDAEERQEFLEELGVRERGLDRMIREAYGLLDLITFFTTGENESRSWTLRRHSLAPEAAGEIHSDFQRGFIRAETIHYDRFVEVGSLKAAKEKGEMRSEGKEYEVVDGDILLFRFNV